MHSPAQEVNNAAEKILGNLEKNDDFSLTAPLRHEAHDIVGGLINTYVLQLAGASTEDSRLQHQLSGSLSLLFTAGYHIPEPTDEESQQVYKEISARFAAGIAKPYEKKSKAELASEAIRTAALQAALEIKDRHKLPSMDFRRMGEDVARELLKDKALATVAKNGDSGHSSATSKKLTSAVIHKLEAQYLKRFDLENADRLSFGTISELCCAGTGAPQGFCQGMAAKELAIQFIDFLSSENHEQPSKMDDKIERLKRGERMVIKPVDWNSAELQERAGHLVAQYMRRADSLIDAQYDAALGKTR